MNIAETNSFLIESLKVQDWWQRSHPENPYPDENIVFFSEDGSVYRKITGEHGEHHWLILANLNKACGWYHTSSPFVKQNIGGQVKVKMTDGKLSHIWPSIYKMDVYPIDNLTYCLCPSEINKDGVEEIDLYLKTNDNHPTMVGHQYPLAMNYDNEWTDPKHLGQQGWENWESSTSLKILPTFNPTSYEDLPTIQWGIATRAEPCGRVPWTSELEPGDRGPNGCTESIGEIFRLPEPAPLKKTLIVMDKGEKRCDPSDLNWYTKQEFLFYYGDTILWEMLSPKKVFERGMIEITIHRNMGNLSENNVNHLLDKMIETFM
jgi:hypothetical protein